MDLQKIKQLDQTYFMNTFGERIPLCFTKGEGLILTDTQGNTYVDLLAGIAVNVLGHSHPALTSAICEQAKKIVHCSSLYYIEKQALLAEKLAHLSGLDKSFFCNSGAEANEGAIKLARLYFERKGQSHKFETITLERSFHGRTLATLAATGQDKFHASFHPLPQKFVSVPANRIDCLEKAITMNTCAVMIEPVQGEGGIHPIDAAYVKKVKQLCEKHDLLLIFDEVQSGIGRTGMMFGFEHFGVVPDIMALAKGLGGGFPIGAFLAKDSVASCLKPGDHGSTFGGNPLACAAALAVLETIEKEGLLEHAKAMGAFAIDQLQKVAKSEPKILEVRGQGLMIGIEFSKEIASTVSKALLEKGLLTGTAGASVLRITPPLIVQKTQILEFVQALQDVLAS